MDRMIDKIIELAFEEDSNGKDVTTNALIPENSRAKATLIAKENGVVAGLEVAKRVFQKLDPTIKISFKVEEGAKVEKGQLLAEIEGNFAALLTAERVALNILQRMSGIATNTANYVKELEGTNTQLLDTRKTAPGMRQLDKMAVVAGGGTNHRQGLYDMVMLKDNHIKVAGSITEAVKQVRAAYGDQYKIEVETTTLEEVEEAVKTGVEMIMLDNMSDQLMAEAVKLVAGRAKTEASGNMELGRIKSAAATGVDYISVGALTHSVKAFDISMNIVQQ